MKKILLFLILCIPVIFAKADIKEGKFTYQEGISNKLINDTYYYSDSYFDKNSFLKNEHLRTFSLALLLGNNENSINIMKEIGLINVKTFTNDKDNIHTVGTIIGVKKLNNYNLIVVLVKNDKKEEWASNFLLGKIGNAEGFNEASKLVIDRIKAYINENNLKNNKILISGYSRSGGVSNLVGIYINEHLNEFDTKVNDLYVYTFEAPNSSDSKKVYKNIHNVINHNDLVTYVAPEGMGFHLNGVEEDITTSRKNIISKYFETSIKDSNKIDQRKFLKEFFKFLSSNVTREEYAKIESDISDLILLFVTMNENDLNSIINFFKKVINEYLYDEDGNLNSINGLALLSLLNSNDKKGSEIPIENIKKFLSSYKENSNYLEIEEKIINIYYGFQKIVYNDFNEKYPLHYILTFTKNFKVLVTDHYLSTIWESTKNQDSYYTMGPGKEKNNNQIQIIEILGLLVLTIGSIVFLIKDKNK